ncbi:MFS general substrate transporter [Trametes gibbosa]|nr:MFS general substrate transporter [Trametes gibbosa]
MPAVVLHKPLPAFTMDIEKPESIHQYEDTSDTGSYVYNGHSAAERKLIRTLDLRIVPASMFLYFLCCIDRFNIGNAKILNNDTGDSLAQTLGLTDRQYVIALMIFFIAYAIFETPSNYMLKKYQPSRWLAFLMFGWGAITMIIAASDNFATLVALRFLLGAFEAGLFPGIVYCLTFWYKPNERALRIALIVACATLGGAFGGAIAYGVGKLNGACGLEAWRWLFIFEGAPCCLCAFVVYFSFPDFPETVSWLSPAERALATERIRGVASLGHHKLTWAEARDTLVDWRLYVHYLLFVAFSVGFASMSQFAPTIIQGLGYEGLRAQLFTVPPYALAFVVCVGVAWAADRYEMRALGAAGAFFVCGVMFLVEALLPPTAFTARYGVLCVALSFAFAISAPSLSWLTANLRNTGASTLAVPLNVSIATIGQITGTRPPSPWICDPFRPMLTRTSTIAPCLMCVMCACRIGTFVYKASEAPAFPTGHYTNAGFMFAGAALALGLRAFYVGKNRSLTPGEQRWRL